MVLPRRCYVCQHLIGTDMREDYYTAFDDYLGVNHACPYFKRKEDEDF